MAKLTINQALAILQPKRSKYNVDHSAAGKAKRTLDGVVYDSIAEMNYAAELAIMARAGKIHRVDRQWSVPLRVKDRLVCNMKIDFRVIYPDGKLAYIDVKGHVTPEWRLKAKLFHAIYGYEIVEVKA